MKAVVYDFCESRAQANAKALLDKWRGSLDVNDFSDVLTSLPTHMNSRIDELLPHRCSPAWCPHVHDKTVDTYLLAGTDKRKSRWDGRMHTGIDSLSWSVFGRRQQVTTLFLWWCGQFFTYHLPHGIDH